MKILINISLIFCIFLISRIGLQTFSGGELFFWGDQWNYWRDYSMTTATGASPGVEPKRPKKQMPVELGYAEEQDPWRLESHFFPSKIGGYPAWLNLSKIPAADGVKCGRCRKPCVFLMQVYAPDSQTEESFHRILYVFLCRNPECAVKDSAENFVVLRSQLPRKNDFFSDQPIDPDFWDPARDLAGDPTRDPDGGGKVKRASDFTKLCCICGLAAGGEKHCGQCKMRFYCCKEHQVR